MELEESYCIRIQRLGVGDETMLMQVADDVFDHAVCLDLTRQFLSEQHNLLVVALDQDLVVGMGSGLFYVHPDKKHELWINEVGVSPIYQRRGIARAIVLKMQERAKTLGCTACWLLTEPDNQAANGLYGSLPGWAGPEKAMLYSIDFSPEG